MPQAGDYTIATWSHGPPLASTRDWGSSPSVDASNGAPAGVVIKVKHKAQMSGSSRFAWANPSNAGCEKRIVDGKDVRPCSMSTAGHLRGKIAIVGDNGNRLPIYNMGKCIVTRIWPAHALGHM